MEGDFLTLWRRFCLESSILGLKYFYLYPDLFSRCFWTISIVSIAYFACTLTFLLHSRFLEMPTRIAIENQYEPLHNLTFPAITICSPNQITISSMMHLNRTLVDGNRSLDFDNILPQLLGLYKVVKVSKEDLGRLHDLMLLNRYTGVELMGLMAQSCDDFLKICYFKRKRYPNCKGLFNPILTMHGMCCIFNGLYAYNRKRNMKINNYDPHKTANTGLSDGLVVVTDYNVDDALNGTLLHGGAIRVMITESSEFPADDESSLVTPHVESFHSFHPTYTYCSNEVSSLPSWSRKCYYEDEYSLRYFNHYRKSDCEVLCRAREFERECRCVMPYVPRVHSYDSCNITSIHCIVDVKANMVRTYKRKIEQHSWSMQAKKNEWYDSKNCDCIPDCESFSYTGDMVLGNMDGLEHVLLNPYSDVVFTKSSSIMHFYFYSPVYVKQKQETVISLISLSSNLGGVFGLCLGCSAISVLEIIFYTFAAVRHKINNRSPKLNNNKFNQITFIH